MQISMTGRTALITGGSDGMGRAMALKFAGAGASVAIAARRQGPLDEALAAIEAVAPGRAAAFSADVGQAEDCERIYRDTVARFGAVDILVNNAGTSQTGKFEEIDDATWQADLDLKLFAAIRLSRLALPDMKARGWGRIVCRDSSVARRRPSQCAIRREARSTWEASASMSTSSFSRLARMDSSSTIDSA